MLSLETLIANCHSRGLRVNNLFELDDGRWQANVTDGLLVWEFGKGRSPNEALAAALFVAASEPGERLAQAQPRVVMLTPEEAGL